MNIQQTRNAQNAIRNAISICESKGGLSEAVSVANQAWIDAGEAYPLPVGEYRRYSWLMADLTRMQVQLADQLRDLEFAAGLPVDEETGVDLREHSGNSIAAAHAEALEENDMFDGIICDGLTPEQRKIESIRMGFDIYGDGMEKAHAEALEVNAVLTHAINCACCHADSDSITHNAIRNAVDYVRHCLLEMNRYNARFIVKMMISAKAHAKKARAAAKVRHQEMVARCATATTQQISNEIPF